MTTPIYGSVPPPTCDRCAVPAKDGETLLDVTSGGTRQRVHEGCLRADDRPARDLYQPWRPKPGPGR